MKFTRLRTPAFLLCSLLLLARTSFADAVQILAFLQTILSEQDENRIPPPNEETRHLLSTLALTPDEVRQILPLAQKGLKSPFTIVRIHTLSVFFSTTLRPDSTLLLEPYLDDITPFLTDADLAFRREAIFIIGQQKPGPSPKAKAALIAHLGDRDNSAEETSMIAGTLLTAYPSDVFIVRTIVNLAQQRPELKLARDMIRGMGLLRVTTDEALAFIRSHFSDPDPDVRLTCIEAVERMPKNIRDGFVPELQRMYANSGETQQIRERAGTVLNQ
jgi:hypothetical protein